MAESAGLRLRLGTIFKYLNATPDSRCVCEGEEVLFANQLVMCGLSDDNTENECNIIALCLQTSALTDQPHEIRGRFLISEKELHIDHFTCSCKAGLSGTCKHVSACLFYCTRNDVHKFEKLSTTDVQCYWTKSKSVVLENYRPEPTNAYSCLDQNFKRPRSLTTEEQEKCLQKLKGGQPLSILNKHSLRICGGNNINSNDNAASTSSSINVCMNPNKIPVPVQNVLQHAADSVFIASLGIDTANLNLRTCCQKLLGIVAASDHQQAAMVTQGSDEWKEVRRLKITGSTCYAVYTYKNLDWEKKSETIFFPKKFNSVYTTHGIKFEKEALAEYKKVYNYDVVELGFLICKLYPWLGYSPDGVVVEHGHPIKLIEIKCPYSGINEDATAFANSCKYLQCDGENITLKKKHQYYGQIQLGLAILNLRECDIILYSSKSKTFLKIPVQFDEIFAAELIKKVSMNYFNKMIHFACKK